MRGINPIFRYMYTYVQILLNAVYQLSTIIASAFLLLLPITILFKFYLFILICYIFVLLQARRNAGMHKKVL